MKHVKWGLKLALLATLGLGQALTAPKANAALFQQDEINQEDVIAIASPIGNSSHQLLILQQLNNQRNCWSESGTTVEPLLLNFDFTGICNRATDSNGYSVRVNNEDLGVHYTLRLAPENNALKLLVSSTRNTSMPPIEIGQATNLPGEFVKITLNPGWRITRRSYSGQQLGHYYLTNDQPLNALQPNSPPSRNPVPSPSPRPVQPSPTPTPFPITPGPTPTPLPTTPFPNPAPTITPAPSPVTPAPLPTVPLPSTPSPSPSTRSAFNYRVTVPAATTTTQNQIRAIVPDAFRTILNGQTVMQVGLFQDYDAALALKETLALENFPATIHDVLTSPTPVLPSARQVIVIDPGHGGRDPGAVGRDNIYEKDIVFDISKQVASLLEAQGMTVVMTRTQDVTVDLEPRVQTAEYYDANVFVSIHANAISLSRPEVNGSETYYYASSEGYALANSIQQRLIQDVGMNDRGVRQARFYVIRRTSMPAALVEVGFVTGEIDAPLLQMSSVRTDMAEAIATGILDYVRGY
ncbi:MAG: DUF3747 domain-containing protein [Cyanobacteria bacterium P01_F01_bin.150]